ncbi:MAG: hypothetical protein R3B06_18840 [Kofleriaceae bacterium]
MKRLGLVLATADEDDRRHLVGLAAAAAGAGIATRVFAMHHGVASVCADPAVRARLAELGCDLVACATSADRAGVDLAAAVVEAGSQDDHAALCAWADRVVAFT